MKAIDNNKHVMQGAEENVPKLQLQYSEKGLRVRRRQDPVLRQVIAPLSHTSHWVQNQTLLSSPDKTTLQSSSFQHSGHDPIIASCSQVTQACGLHLFPSCLISYLNQFLLEKKIIGLYSLCFCDLCKFNKELWQKCHLMHPCQLNLEFYGSSNT